MCYLTVMSCIFYPAGQTEGQTSPGQMVDEPIHPVNIPRREKDFQGMLEYKKEDELKLVKNLILGKSSFKNETRTLNTKQAIKNISVVIRKCLKPVSQ